MYDYVVIRQHIYMFDWQIGQGPKGDVAWCTLFNDLKIVPLWTYNFSFIRPQSSCGVAGKLA